MDFLHFHASTIQVTLISNAKVFQLMASVHCCEGSLSALHIRQVLNKNCTLLEFTGTTGWADPLKNKYNDYINDFSLIN